MAGNLSAQATLILQITKVDENVMLMNRSVPGLANPNLTSYSYESYKLIPAVATAVDLPATTVLGFYIKNLSGAGASVQVKWTQKGAPGNVSILDLAASDTVFFMCPASSAVSGITALELTASAGSVPVELLLIG